MSSQYSDKNTDSGRGERISVFVPGGRYTLLVPGASGAAATSGVPCVSAVFAKLTDPVRDDGSRRVVFRERLASLDRIAGLERVLGALRAHAAGDRAASLDLLTAIPEHSRPLRSVREGGR